MRLLTSHPYEREHTMTPVKSTAAHASSLPRRRPSLVKLEATSTTEKPAASNCRVTAMPKPLAPSRRRA